MPPTLKKRADFTRVQRGQKWVTPAFILYCAPDERTAGAGPARFGFTVSSKAVAVAKNARKKRGSAVDRNRARRRLKEAVRLSAGLAAPACDYVVIGRAEALRVDFARLLDDMEMALKQLRKRAARETFDPAAGTAP